MGNAEIRRGSLELVRLGLGVKAAVALLQYTIPFLLAYGLARNDRDRLCLWIALTLTIIGGLGIIALPIPSVKLRRITTPNGELYVPEYEINYNSWPYPALLALSHAGGILYIITYALVAARSETKDNSLSKPLTRPHNPHLVLGRRASR